MIHLVADPSVPPHTILVFKDKTGRFHPGLLLGRIRDVDGVEASAQADGDPRAPGEA